MAQSWELTPSWGLNSEDNDIFCSPFFDDVIYSSADKRQRHSDRELGDKSFGLHLAQRGDSYDILEALGGLFESDGQFDTGTAHFSEVDSTLWFSTANSLSDTHSGRVGIYSCKWTGETWADPEPFRHNSHYHDVMHPHVSEKGQLYFCSDMDGTRGKLDIWYSVELEGRWSIPVNLSHVNTNENEVFPTAFADTIYFSRQVIDRGLDIFASWKESQEGKTLRLREPFNSEYDDFMLVWLDDELGFMTSNRLVGTDDIFTLRKRFDPAAQPVLTGLLECLGEEIKGAQVTVYNGRGEVIISDLTSESGTLALEGLLLDHTYKIQVTAVPKALLEKAVFFFVDEAGNRVRMFRLGKDGFFIFDFLPLDDYDNLSHLENVDQSVLTIPMQGQVYENTPGDLNKVQTIYIMDDEENLLALAYTSQTGNFSVPDIRPLSEYMFRIEEGDRELQLVIFEGEYEHVIPVDDDLAKFSRIAQEEAVRLVDENNEEMFIRDDEVFIIKNIYYRLDSANINIVAEQQLGQLAKIMKANPQVSLTLSSHTDSRGTIDYNLELSERRASNAFLFLTSAGIEAMRIDAKGYGETYILNRCIDDVECDEQDHALNRRTEIQIRVNEGY